MLFEAAIHRILYSTLGPEKATDVVRKAESIMKSRRSYLLKSLYAMDKGYKKSFLELE